MHKLDTFASSCVMGSELLCFGFVGSNYFILSVANAKNVECWQYLRNAVRQAASSDHAFLHILSYYNSFSIQLLPCDFIYLGASHFDSLPNLHCFLPMGNKIAFWRLFLHVAFAFLARISLPDSTINHPFCLVIYINLPTIWEKFVLKLKIKVCQPMNIL